MSALSSLAVYPESMQSSVGLPGTLSTALLVDSMEFRFEQTKTEWSDEDDVPDIIIYSNPKIEIDVKAVLKNRSGDFAQYAGGATRLALNTLPFNSAAWWQGYSAMASAGAYAIFESPRRTSAKAKPDDFSFTLRLHGAKPATRFPV